MRCRSGKARWRTKTKTPTADAVAAPHRRRQPIEQLVPCYCRRSPSRARVRTAIKVYGGSFLLIVLCEGPERARTGVPHVSCRIWPTLRDDPVARCARPAPGATRRCRPPLHRSPPELHRRPNLRTTICRPTTISLKRRFRRPTPAQPHTAGSSRSSRSFPVVAAARLARAREGRD